MFIFCLLFGGYSGVVRGSFRSALRLLRDNFGSRSTIVWLLFALLPKNDRSRTDQMSNQPRSNPEVGTKHVQSILERCWHLNGLEETLRELRGLCRP
ncbi:hypothetical protein OHD16_24665 [Sphingobacterium sp. ML3W]|uniref:hypothetical protein n=1 Tax=Sphingobacterium sp. ML3W TaxID=1538644 RepID=UPI00249AD03F|nr:hypothetical protein [Sphingobacterium sp. ML3W]WFA77900.1 hypothetical protein OGI71_17805 [Sphingobacterium sp. ML3W]